MEFKKKTVNAYVDGKFLCDVLQAALDNNKGLRDMKEVIVSENPNRTVTFKAEPLYDK